MHLQVKSKESTAHHPKITQRKTQKQVAEILNTKETTKVQRKPKMKNLEATRKSRTTLIASHWNMLKD